MDVETSLVPSQVDGGPLEMETVGSGPAVVIVHGGGVDASVYRRLAKRLGTSFTVHVYNRRGRGRSAPRPADYALSTEIGDLGSVLATTGSTRLVGHSIGGFFALAAARELPIERLALFDPAVDVDGAFPTDYLDEFERLIAEGDIRAAMLVMGRGLRNPGSDWPEPAQRAAVRAVLLTPPGRTMARLLHTVPAEARLALEANGPAYDWASVTAVTRFYIGARSPDYYLPTANSLVEAMPQASIEVVPRLGHDALARAGSGLVKSLGAFLSPDMR
ncbi:MAG: alpha/beta hydrolase [Candidatus Nanopelagicales bacterium]